jgi:tetratricopeptide (TPR) repeat protein
MKKTLFLAAALFAAACMKEEQPAQPASEPGTAAAPAEPPKPPPPMEMSITSKSPEAVELYKKGRDLAENFRPAEAIEQFKAALAKDPDFALAHGYTGILTPGAEGLASLEKAASLSATLPEAEKTWIEQAVAQRKGDEAKARELVKKMTELSPTDWRTHFYWAAQLYGERKLDESAAALKKATELNPGAGAGWNMLGYVSLLQGKNDDAIAAFKKYVELNNEPNSHDSLAEALMKAGKFEEAEAEFRKATELSPQFWFGWTGVAFTKAFRGDWAGAKEAMAKAKEAAPRPIDKLAADQMTAWFLFAEGKAADAMKTLDAVEKEAEAQKAGAWASSAVTRSIFLAEGGKYKDALKAAAAAEERGTKLGLPGENMLALRREALQMKAYCEARMNKAADAEKTLAALEEEAKKAPSNAQLQSGLHFVRGSIALAKGDAKGAAEHFGQCIPEDAYCHWMHATAMEKAGDAAGGEAMKASLRAANLRDPTYLYVRGKLGSAPVAAAAATAK